MKHIYMLMVIFLLNLSVSVIGAEKEPIKYKRNKGIAKSGDRFIPERTVGNDKDHQRFLLKRKMNEGDDESENRDDPEHIKALKKHLTKRDRIYYFHKKQLAVESDLKIQQKNYTAPVPPKKRKRVIPSSPDRILDGELDAFIQMTYTQQRYI